MKTMNLYEKVADEICQQMGSALCTMHCYNLRDAKQVYDWDDGRMWCKFDMLAGMMYSTMLDPEESIKLAELVLKTIRGKEYIPAWKEAYGDNPFYVSYWENFVKDLKTSIKDIKNGLKNVEA